MWVELPDGRRLKLDNDYFGVEWFAWRYGLIEPLIQAPNRIEQNRFLTRSGQEARQSIIPLVQHREGVKPLTAVIDTHWYTIKNDRVVESDDHLRISLTEGVSR